MPKLEGLDRLTGIRATTYKRTLFFYADDSLALGDVAEILSEVRAQLPRWHVFVITPATNQPCQEWLDAHSGPAA